MRYLSKPMSTFFSASGSSPPISAESYCIHNKNPNRPTCNASTLQVGLFSFARYCQSGSSPPTPPLAAAARLVLQRPDQDPGQVPKTRASLRSGRRFVVQPVLRRITRCKSESSANSITPILCQLCVRQCFHVSSTHYRASLKTGLLAGLSVIPIPVPGYRIALPISLFRHLPPHSQYSRYSVPVFNRFLYRPYRGGIGYRFVLERCIAKSKTNNVIRYNDYPINWKNAGIVRYLRRNRVYRKPYFACAFFGLLRLASRSHTGATEAG